jgi:Ion channel
MNLYRHRHLWDFWTAESGLTGLLIFTLAYLFVVCALGDFNFGALVGRLMFSLIIVAGVLTTFRQRWLRYLVIVLALASFSLIWLEHIYRLRTLTILNPAFGMLFLFFLLAILIVQVFRRGEVTPHKIRGAIVVYLLLGGMWAFFYFIIALNIPHSFNWPEGMAVGDLQAVQQTLTYFSFITLTTTGYGDVTPAIPLTRTLAMFEALTGQLYLVITLARLVSLAVVGRQGAVSTDVKD